MERGRRTDPTTDEMLLLLLQRLEAHELLFARLIAKGVLTEADRQLVQAAVDHAHQARVQAVSGV